MYVLGLENNYIYKVLLEPLPWDLRQYNRWLISNHSTAPVQTYLYIQGEPRKRKILK